MQLQMKLTWRIRAGVLTGLLALLCIDSTVGAEQDRVQWPPHVQSASGRARPIASSAVVRIERVDFVLDQDAQTKEKEAEKKRKAEQHRAATAKTKPGPKAASAAAASTASASSSTASATPAAGLAPASSAVTTAPAAASSPEGKRAASTGGAPVAALNAASSSDAKHAGTGSPTRLTREQLTALMPGATIRRTNTAGALRQWVNGADGTLTVYWAGGGFVQSHSASGKWSVTADGHFCLQIDWPDVPENWCHFLEPTANGAYQPIPDIVDAGWTPPKDKTEWRPLTIRR